jgi:hypothetical protein
MSTATPSCPTCCRRSPTARKHAPPASTIGARRYSRSSSREALARSYSTFGSVLGPYDRPNFQNDIAPIAAPSPNIRNGFFKSIERSENIASARITPDPKWFMLAERTFDLLCHDAKPCLMRQRL